MLLDAERIFAISEKKNNHFNCLQKKFSPFLEPLQRIESQIHFTHLLIGQVQNMFNIYNSMLG